MASLRNNERKASANKESSGTDSDAIYNYDLYKLQSSKSSHRHHKHRNKSHRKHQCRSESYRTAEEEEKKKKRSSSCSYKLYKDQQQLMEESAFDGQNMLVNYSNENLVNRPKQPYFYHNEPASSQTYLDKINGGHLLCSNNMMNNHKNYNNNKAKNITFNLPTQNQKALRHSYTYDQFPNSNYFDSNYIQVQSQQVNQLNYLKASFSNNDSLGKLANMSGANKHQEIIAVSKETNNPYIILRPAGINSGKGGRILIPRSKSSMPSLATPKKANALEGQQRKPGPHAANYSDLVAANASFIDSPIHLLMNHHENQRLLKQQTKELTHKARTPGQNCAGNEGENFKPRAKNHEQKIRFEFDYPAERMTRNISVRVFLKSIHNLFLTCTTDVYTLKNWVNIPKPKHKTQTLLNPNPKSKHKTHKFLNPKRFWVYKIFGFWQNLKILIPKPKTQKLLNQNPKSKPNTQKPKPKNFYIQTQSLKLFIPKPENFLGKTSGVPNIRLLYYYV